MAVSSADVRAIVERVCARPDVLDACARRDLGAVISALGSAGVTQGQVSALTGVPQGRLSEWKTGKREAKGVSTFQKFADGVGLPAAARRALGLAAAAVPEQTRARPRRGMTLTLPGRGGAGDRERCPHCGGPTWPTRARSCAAGSIPRAWGDASLAVAGRSRPHAEQEPARGVRIGIGDVTRFRATVEMFAELDNRFGGGHAREALIQYLSVDGDRLLRGRYTDAVGRELFSAVAEATLLAAWMTYDSAPTVRMLRGISSRRWHWPRPAVTGCWARASWTP